MARSLQKLGMNGTSETLLKRVKRQYLMFLILCSIKSLSDIYYMINYEDFNTGHDHKVFDAIKYVCLLCYFLIMVSEPFVWYKVCESKDIIL